MFFSFDGIDGAGKSTQMRLFCDALRRAGYEVVDCRDPGSTAVGDAIREMLLHGGDNLAIGRRCEMLLYMAARAQLVDEVICPALAAGKIVVSDRYLLANIVYQGHAGGLDLETVRTVGRVATDAVMPDCVFLLDMRPQAADERLSRALDRMESQGDAYRERLRAGFLAEAAQDAGRIHVIEASRPIASVQSDINQIAARLLHRNAL
jgi:dTMP kinase